MRFLDLPIFDTTCEFSMTCPAYSSEADKCIKKENRPSCSEYERLRERQKIRRPPGGAMPASY